MTWTHLHYELSLHISRVISCPEVYLDINLVILDFLWCIFSVVVVVFLFFIFWGGVLFLIF